jgi:hypothetical protein
MNGYGQFFLLVSAIGLIFLATSGKGLELLNVLKGNTLPYGVTGDGSSGTGSGTKTQPKSPTKPKATGVQEPTNPTDPKEWIKDKDKANSGSGGTMS